MPACVNPGGGASRTMNPPAAAHSRTSSGESPMTIGAYSRSPLQLHTYQSSAISAYLFAFSPAFLETSVTGITKNSPYRLGSGHLSVFTIIRYVLFRLYSARLASGSSMKTGSGQPFIAENSRASSIDVNGGSDFALVNLFLTHIQDSSFCA